MSNTERRFTDYHRRDDQTVHKLAQMGSRGFDSIWKENIKPFKAREGKNIVRILPPGWENPEHYAYDVYYNRNIGVENNCYLSLSKMLHKPDPIAEAYKRALAEAAEATTEAKKQAARKLADSLRPVHRRVSWVVDRLAEDEGPQVWDCPISLDEYIINKARDEDTLEIIMVDDPDFGCDVRFYREGTGRNTKYDGSKVKLLTSTPLHEDPKLAREWVDYVKTHPIPDLLNFYDYKHIANVFNGNVYKGEDGVDEEYEAPKVYTASSGQKYNVGPHEFSKVSDSEPDTEALASTLRSRLAARAKPAPFDDDDE